MSVSMILSASMSVSVSVSASVSVSVSMSVINDNTSIRTGLYFNFIACV